MSTLFGHVKGAFTGAQADRPGLLQKAHGGIVRAYGQFSRSPQALWSGNFRELSASITRMATLADGGRISTELVRDEIRRLEASWSPRGGASTLDRILTSDELAQLDLFDRIQLEGVVGTCRTCTSLAEAGRRLFTVSRTRRSVMNDTDRLKKYLARFGLDWARVRS